MSTIPSTHPMYAALAKTQTARGRATVSRHGLRVFPAPIGTIVLFAATLPCSAQFTVQSFGPATWNADPAIIDVATGMTGATFETFEDYSLDPNLSISYNSGPPTSEVTYDDMLD